MNMADLQSLKVKLLESDIKWTKDKLEFCPLSITKDNKDIFEICPCPFKGQYQSCPCPLNGQTRILSLSLPEGQIREIFDFVLRTDKPILLRNIGCCP